MLGRQRPACGQILDEDEPRDVQSGLLGSGHGADLGQAGACMAMAWLRGAFGVILALQELLALFTQPVPDPLSQISVTAAERC